MTKKEILEKLKKTYERATDRIFTEDCHTFNDHDFTCRLTVNPDKTLTITIKAELCSTNAQEIHDNVTITHHGWNAYNRELDSVVISRYETSETVSMLVEIVPTIKKMITKIKRLHFKN